MKPAQIPNLLTFARLALAIVSFVYLHQLIGADGDPVAIESIAFKAFWLYLVAVATDFLDGRIARRYGWVSSLGRIADPVVDKVLILGGMMFLAAAPFLTTPEDFGPVMPVWFVVLVMTREFLVTALRGLVESKGMSFAAEAVGKWKMVAQSAYVLILIGRVAMIPEFLHIAPLRLVCHPAFVVFLFWAVVGMTVWSGFDYSIRAARMLSKEQSS
ncbi:MAG: CDP-alcohol phosphatidyltransferase family protein [Planctomycetota bacterium]|jgi:CDP-diacylglycerol--glycerol-3-phosphate 3-phosphatidyltransferase|nr:CDP-alcohol phosphatidyltransferase family protein [Planctomycetota bacterium]MDP7245766.1 CDP-alcohol phosphatidyltransferase family protein [Planctomycetota bacterium]|tara:strand:- start:8759 stop:9403 length:645 start_codon:yes stop_codon:yes gene_type:complete